MPIFLEPDATYPVVLESDEGKTPCPTFIAKAQGMRGQAAIAATLDELNSETSKTAQQLFDSIIGRLLEVLVGWENMGVEFSEEALRDLTYQEAREVLTKVMYNQHVTPEEKKSSE